MNPGIVIVIALLIASCARQPMPAIGVSDMPSLRIDRGVLADFATPLPVCIWATDMTTGDDLSSAVAAAITAYLPDLEMSCQGSGHRMTLTFQVNVSAYTHSSRPGPRFGFSHLAITHKGRGLYAEAAMWDNSGGSSSELVSRAASIVSAFIKSARTQLPPNPYQPPSSQAHRSSPSGHARKSKRHR